MLYKLINEDTGDVINLGFSTPGFKFTYYGKDYNSWLNNIRVKITENWFIEGDILLNNLLKTIESSEGGMSYVHKLRTSHCSKERKRGSVCCTIDDGKDFIF